MFSVLLCLILLLLVILEDLDATKEISLGRRILIQTFERSAVVNAVIKRKLLNVLELTLATVRASPLHKIDGGAQNSSIVFHLFVALQVDGLRDAIDDLLSGNALATREIMRGLAVSGATRIGTLLNVEGLLSVFVVARDVLVGSMVC